MTEPTPADGARHPHGQVRTTVVDDHVLHMTVDRVEKKNAFTPKITRELGAALTRLDEDPDLWVGALSFAGEHTTAGLDMPLFFGPDADRGQPDGPEPVDPFGLRRRLTKPLVSAVQGITFTIGIEIPLAGDIIVAASDARFCQLEPKRGLAPLGGATIRYVQRAGWGNAMYHLLTADEFTAAEAYRIGLVQEVVEPGRQVEPGPGDRRRDRDLCATRPRAHDRQRPPRARCRRAGRGGGDPGDERCRAGHRRLPGGHDVVHRAAKGELQRSLSALLCANAGGRLAQREVAVALTVEVRVNGTANASGRYLTWAPSPLELRVTDAAGATAPIRVRVRTRPRSRGRLAFRTAPAAAPTPEVTLDLDHRGRPSALFVAGEFGLPSRADGDTTLEVLRPPTTTVVTSVPLMVRVRKDAETLTVAERDRFLRAIARLNDRGAGKFRDFRNMHTDDTTDEAHFFDGFLPWHRAYLLDLERELQRDRSVGVACRTGASTDRRRSCSTPPSSGRPTHPRLARLTPSNPLQLWTTDGVPGIDRSPFFDPSDRRRLPTARPARCWPEAATRAAQRALRPGCDQLRGQPARRRPRQLRRLHQRRSAPPPRTRCSSCCTATSTGSGRSGSGSRRRFDAARPPSYLFRGSADERRAEPGSGTTPLDTMWPWNDVPRRRSGR